MTIEQQFSKENLRQIGIRLHAARVLTGMRREEFADKQNISVTSIKNWELGRALPRHDKIVSVVNTLKDCGIFASQEWLLFGNGIAPNYISQSSTHEYAPETAEIDKFIDEQSKLFCKAKRAQGFTPVTARITDNSMAPYYNKGDFVGAVHVSHEYVKEMITHQQCAWLITNPTGLLTPAFLFFSGERWFYNTARRAELKELFTPSVAKILWHYSPDFAL